MSDNSRVYVVTFNSIFAGCVDVWDPKVVRSAAGAHFRLPIHHSIDWEKMPTFLDQNSSIFIADSNAKVLINSVIQYSS